VLLDERVPRDSHPDAALAELKAAIEAFHRKPLDAFPAGWTVLGFAQDVNRWVQAARAGTLGRALPRPTRGTLASELFADDPEPAPRPNAVNTTWSEA
jgi:hypothetical protein